MLGAVSFLGAVSLQGILGRVPWARADGQGTVIHWPADLSKLQGLEVDHVPLIRVQPAGERKDLVNLEIQVGQRLHEMTLLHAIHWVQLWVDEHKVSQMTLTPGRVVPKWRFTLRRMGSMRVMVRVGCNRHGIWANRLAV